MSYYPTIDPQWLLPLDVILSSLKEDPLWLERSECPYDEVTIDQIKSMWVKVRTSTPRETAKSGNLADADDKWEHLMNEMTSLYDELKNFSADVNPEDVKERMTYFRTATALLDKLTTLAERANNIREVSRFKNAVLSVFDEILSPEQRTLAMEKLGE